jgi:hypothetical protein
VSNDFWGCLAAAQPRWPVLQVKDEAVVAVRREPVVPVRVELKWSHPLCYGCEWHKGVLLRSKVPSFVAAASSRGDAFTIDPVIPKDWPGFHLRYRFQNTIYVIRVENPEHCSRGVILVELDGVAAAGKIITLRDDALPDDLRVVLGDKPPT